MKEKGELSSLIFGLLAIAVIGTILISGPTLMETEKTGFFPLSFEGEETPPAEPTPEPSPEPAPVSEPLPTPVEAPPEPVSEPQSAPEPMPEPPQKQPPAEMSPEEVYQDLPEEAQAYVTIEDIKAMDTMGIDNQAAMEAEIAEMILEGDSSETELSGGYKMPPGNQGEYEDYGSPKGEEMPRDYSGMPPEGKGEPEGGMQPSGDYSPEGDYSDYGPPEGGYEEPKGGPGGCKTMRECMEYCKKEENQAECGREGAPENRKRGPPEGQGPPKEIPKMILERGMEKHFIEIMCLEMHLHMAIPIQHSIKTTKEVFADVKQEFGLESLNTSKLEAVNVLIEKRINALCNSNKDNFGDNITALMKMTMPGGQMEMAMSGMGDQIDEAFLLKIEPGEKNAIKREEAEIEKKRIEVELQYAQEEDKKAYLQNRINELNAVINDTSSGMTMEELEAFSQRMGNFMGTVQERMNTDFEESQEYKELAQKVYKKEYGFFLEMIEMGLQEMEEGIQEMEAQELDASVLKEMKAFMEGMKEKGKEMLKDEYKKQEFFAELEAKMPEFEKKINESMKQQTKELFLPKAENNLIRLKNAIELAKQKGMNATELETLVKEIKPLVEELKLKIDSADSKEDFMEIGNLGKSIRKRMERARELYEKLRGEPQ